MTYNVFGGTLSLTQSINHSNSSATCTIAERYGDRVILRDAVAGTPVNN